jgi:hypothetical protein
LKRRVLSKKNYSTPKKKNPKMDEEENEVRIYPPPLITRCIDKTDFHSPPLRPLAGRELETIGEIYQPWPGKFKLTNPDKIHEKRMCFSFMTTDIQCNEFHFS